MFGAAIFLYLFLSPGLTATLRGQQIIKDDLGYDFPLEKPPQRIISLAPNVTEILFALELGPRVAAVTRFCNYPPEAADKEKVGGLVDPDLEKIRALQPDLVIAYRGNPLPIVLKMRELQMPVFVLDEGNTLDSLLALIVRIGQVTRQDRIAEALVSRLTAERDKVRTALQKASSRPRVFLLLPGAGLWTCGRQSYLHDLLEQAAAVNVAAGISRPWADYSPEQLLSDDPDVLVILARSDEEFRRARVYLKNDSRLKGLRAVRLGRSARLDENKASRFGPRLMETYAELARSLHPDCFQKR